MTSLSPKLSAEQIKDIEERGRSSTFDEQELLALSVKQSPSEDEEGHKYAADFRIGFRYGYPRGYTAGATDQALLHAGEVKEMQEIAEANMKISLKHQNKNIQLNSERDHLKALLGEVSAYLETIETGLVNETTAHLAGFDYRHTANEAFQKIRAAMQIGHENKGE